MELRLTRFLSETVFFERADAFWPVLDGFASGRLHALEDGSPQERYRSLKDAIARSGSLSAVGEAESLAFSLALKEAAPRLEAHASLYRDLLPAVKHALSQVANTTDDCDSWVLFDDKPFCSSESLAAALSTDLASTSNRYVGSSDAHAGRQLMRCLGLRLFQSVPFDHPPYREAGHLEAAATAVLYASGRPSSFLALHRTLAAASESSSRPLRYILRWKPNSNPDSRARPGGWGVALDLKRTDYLVIDDRHDGGPATDISPVLGSRDAAAPTTVLDGPAVEPLDLLTAASPSIIGLTAAQISDLAIKATQLIMRSSNPLLSMRLLSEDFPIFAHPLATRWVSTVDQDIDAELLNNSMTKIEAGSSAFFLNNLQLLPHEMNQFSLVRIMRRERRLMLDLEALGLNFSQSRRLLASPVLNKPQHPRPGRDGIVPPEALGELFEADDAVEGGDVVTWWNDLEKDRRYLSWSRSVREVRLVGAV